MRNRFLTLALMLAFSATLPGAAFAYIGPGAGLSAIGTMLALVGAVLLAIVGFVWYPVKRLLKGRKKPASEATAEVAPDGK